MRGALQRRHAYVLVDEVQDSNALQLRLLTLLAPPPPRAADCSSCPEQATLPASRCLGLQLLTSYYCPLTTNILPAYSDLPTRLLGFCLPAYSDLWRAYSRVTTHLG